MSSGAVNSLPDLSYVTRIVHRSSPDFQRRTLEIPVSLRKRIRRRLRFLYGEEQAESCLEEIVRILRVYYAHKPCEMIKREEAFNPKHRFSEKDVILITYGDLLKGGEASALSTLAKFCDTYLRGSINTLHILPFFPYSSDRGFAVIDFETVDPHLGDWSDIEKLESRYRLMFDGVINHVSSQSRWFQEFLNGHPYFQDFFIAYKSPEELRPEEKRPIFRPRTSELLSPYQTIDGPRWVWTTFSKDQVDLNYKNPQVLLRVIEVLLFYVRHGADLIRLDAVGFLWAEPGTRCLHLEQTHQIVRLFRDILDVVAPEVALVTETNVPHEENISYFGNGEDEAQMVYNFSLPPLVLYTFYSEDSTVLSKWAESLDHVPEGATFFNVLDSHDGIGLLGARNILTEQQIAFLIEKARKHGGIVSFKDAPDGRQEPYELNITWFSALNIDDTDEDLPFQVKRFVASRAIPLVLKGVPGVYLNSLIGTVNDIELVLQTHSNRDINRQVTAVEAVYAALQDPYSKISRINRELGRLIALRTRQAAFHPAGEEHILFLSRKVFAVFRSSTDQRQHILALTNVTEDVLALRIPLAQLPFRARRWTDLVQGQDWVVDGDTLEVTVLPFEVCWLSAEGTCPEA